MIDLLQAPLAALGTLGIKIVLTVSPVPLSLTFAAGDCVTADTFSKAALLVAAQHFSETMDHVDCYPSYDIVRSGGPASFTEDNRHVRNDLVRSITARMVEAYAAAGAA